MIKNSLARWANISSTMVKTNPQDYDLNTPYRVCIDKPLEDAEKWDRLQSNHSAYKIVDATVQLLRSQVTLPTWEQGTKKFIDEMFDLDELHQLACDLDNAVNKDFKECGRLAALNALDV